MDTSGWGSGPIFRAPLKQPPAASGRYLAYHAAQQHCRQRSEPRRLPKLDVPSDNRPDLNTAERRDKHAPQEGKHRRGDGGDTQAVAWLSLKFFYHFGPHGGNEHEGIQRVHHHTRQRQPGENTHALTYEVGTADFTPGLDTSAANQ